MDKEYPLVYSKYDTNTDLSTLTRPLSFNGQSVPQNFTTNFITTYWFIRWFVPRYGRANIAAVIHDWQYVSPLFMSRAEADWNFRNNLIKLGYSKARATLYWLGVRMGGRKTWNDKFKQKLNPGVIAREARSEARKIEGELQNDIAVMVERTSGIIPGVTRPKETA